MSEKKTVHEELCRIQAELKAPKNLQGHGYKHRSAEGILEAFKKVRGECRLKLQDRVEMVGDRVYVVATATLTAGDGGAVTASAWAREPDKLANMSAPQVSGACSSYARKYALNGLLAIDDNKEPDNVNNAEDAEPVKEETLERLKLVSDTIIDAMAEFNEDRIAAGIRSVSQNRTDKADELTEPEALSLISILEKQLK